MLVLRTLNETELSHSHWIEKLYIAVNFTQKELSNNVKIIKIELVELIQKLSNINSRSKSEWSRSFLTIFCFWSHHYFTFAWLHQSPVAILIQPRACHLRAMVRGWTSGMMPRYNSLPRQKKFWHDNTIREELVA